MNQNLLNELELAVSRSLTEEEKRILQEHYEELRAMKLRLSQKLLDQLPHIPHDHILQLKIALFDYKRLEQNKNLRTQLETVLATGKPFSIEVLDPQDGFLLKYDKRHSSKPTVSQAINWLYNRAMRTKIKPV